MAEPLTHGRSYVFQVRVGNAGGWSASARSDTVMLAVVPDTPGRVSLSTTTPQVGDALTATLVDPDVPIALQQWHWSYLVPSGASGASGANGDVVSPSASVSKTLRVSTVHLGLRILSRMSYTDAHGQQQAQSDTTSAVVGPPWAPQTVTATAGDGQVVLAWAAPLKTGGAAITSYTYRYKASGGSWPDSWTSAGTSTSQTVTSLTNGTAYSFEVRAVNSYGDGTVASAEATPQATVCSLTGPTGPTVAENATASVGTYTVGGGCGASSSWTLGGTDAGSFELQTVQGSSSSRTLHFRSTPNYEVKHSYQVSVGVSDGSLSASVAVAVSVTDANDSGRIGLSTTTPRAGQPLTATLSDDDGVEEPVYWTPSYVRASDAGGVTGQAAATEATQTWTLTIPRSRVGQKLRIQAHYTDSFGASTATSALTAAIGADNRPPCSPTAFTAVAGAAQVSLSWRAPTGTNCGTLTHYEYRYKQTSGSWPDNWTSAGTATSQTVEDLINSTAYTFEVRAANDYGQSASVSKSATPQQPNRAPVVSGSASVSGDENKTDSLGKYTASDPDGDALTWSVSGTDASSFELKTPTPQGTNPSRTLHFRRAPDYETKNSYQVRVKVSDGSLADSVDVAVSVNNVEEPGSVVLTASTTPQVGTAVVARLTDLDGGITGASWQWQRRSSSTGSWAAIGAGATGEADATGATSQSYPEQSSYTPVSGDVGWHLRATVSYRDGHGPNKSAEGPASASVIGPPGAPKDLKAVAGNGQVSLSWKAPTATGGTPITGYAYRYKKTASTSWTQDWPAAASGTTTSQVVRSLTNGTPYTFEVRAYNKVGSGTAASESATPQQPNRAPVVSGSASVSGDENKTASLGKYTASDPDSDALSWSVSGTDASAFELQASDSASSRNLHFVSAPDYETKHSYQVRVRVSDGSLADSVDVAVSVTDVNEAPVVSGSASVSGDENKTASLGKYTASDPDSDALSWSVSGTDASAFELQASDSASSRNLHFVSAPDYETKSSYQVRVRVSDGSLADSVDVAVSVTDVNEAPVVSGSASVSGDENKTASLGKYTASDPDSDALSWSVSGTDASAFELQASDSASSRNLHFVSKPNYETKSSYQVSVGVSDGSLSARLAVSVSVNNVEEAGSVTLSSTQPKVGQTLRATLRDDDGQIVVSRWAWERFPQPFGAAGASGLANSEFTPSAGEVGQYVRVTVYYSDGHGSNKQAQSAQTEAIVDVPGVPGLSASPGNGQATLNWTAPTSDGGSAITGYEYRQSGASSWTLVSGGGSARSQTVKGLTNGTAYTFEVRAKNGVGSGTAASKSVTPQQPNRAPSVSCTGSSIAENSTGTVSTCTGSDPDGNALSWSLSGTNASAFQLQGSGSSRTLRFRSAPNYESKSSYQVSVRVSDGSLSASQSVSVSVTNVNEAPSVSGSSSASIAENSTGSLGTYTGSDPDGNALSWSLSGTNASAFQLQGSGSSRTLRFRSAPNYESKSSYQVSVRVSDGSLSASQSVSVSVTDVNEAPSVSGSSSALIAENSTGSLGTYTGSDPDSDALSWSLSGTNASSFQLQGSGSSRTLRFRSAPNYESKSSYQVSVRVSDGSLSASQSVSVSVTNVNEAPSVSCPSSASIAENSTGTVASCTATDPEGNALSWSLSGTNASAFQLQGSGSSSRTFRFRSAPNYESKSSYQVSVRVSDGSLSASQSVSVSVTNVDEKGSLSLTGKMPPQVGSTLTARLSDPDGGLNNIGWAWRTLRAGGADDEGDAEPPAVAGANGQSNTYTPATPGVRIQVTVSYTDGHGPNKRLHRQTDSVIGKPGRPGNLSARPGNIYTRVDLSWTAAAANGSSITNYQYRYRRGTSRWSSWSSVGVMTSYTVSNLTSGATYTFEVRAVNAVGAGTAAETSGTARAETEETETETEETETETEETETETEETETETEEAPAAKVALPDAGLAGLAAPNPFNPHTTLHVQLPTSGPVRLTLYNVAGQVVHTLVDRALEAGYHTFHWDGRDQHGRPVPSGVYLYRLSTGQHVLVGKMALIR